jgi:hypothetical protein
LDAIIKNATASFQQPSEINDLKDELRQEVEARKVLQQIVQEQLLKLLMQHLLKKMQII